MSESYHYRIQYKHSKGQANWLTFKVVKGLSNAQAIANMLEKEGPNMKPPIRLVRITVH